MTLSEYLKLPVPPGLDCARWVLQWLKESGRSDLIDRLNAHELARAYAAGDVLACATAIAEREGLRETTEPREGDPVCVAAPGPDGSPRQAMALALPPFVALIAHPRGVAAGRWPILMAWSV